MVKSVGIVGYGTIGQVVGKALDEGIEGLELVGVVGRNTKTTKRAVADLTMDVPVLTIAELAEKAEIILDCAPTTAFRETADTSLKNGCTIITVNAAAILENPDLADKAAAHDTQVILATGALLGLDAVRAAAEGVIHSVDMITRKPPKSLVKAKYVQEQGLDLLSLTKAIKLFDGSAGDGAKNFPANVNVAAALGLAGIGPNNTHLEIWADPDVEYNTHTINVDSDSAKLSLKIENVPTVENPGTGKITALSVLATLKSLVNPLKIGT